MPIDLTTDPALPLLRRELIRMAAFGVSGEIVILSNGGRITGMKPRYQMRREFAQVTVDYQRELTQAETECLELVDLLIPDLWARRREVQTAQIIISVVAGVPQPDFGWEPYLPVLKAS